MGQDEAQTDSRCQNHQKENVPLTLFVAQKENVPLTLFVGAETQVPPTVSSPEESSSKLNPLWPPSNAPPPELSIAHSTKDFVDLCDL
jgi:hypothetical protein